MSALFRLSRASLVNLTQAHKLWSRNFSTVDDQLRYIPRDYGSHVRSQAEALAVMSGYSPLPPYIASPRDPNPSMLMETGKIREIIFNRPKQLNTFVSEDIRRLDEIMERYDKHHECTIAVALNGKGHAFCGGTNFKDIYNSLHSNKESDALDYLKLIYRLNHRVNGLKALTMGIVDGLALGSGAALAMTTRCTVATQNASFMFPEASFGYFPDAGSSHYLSRLPYHFGTYLAMTGFRIRGSNAIYAGTATHYLIAEMLPSFKDHIDSLHSYHVDRLLQSFEYFSTETEPFVLAPYANKIEEIFGKASVVEIFKALEADESLWAKETLAILHQKSPLSLNIILRQLREAETKSFDECLVTDYRLAQKFFRGKDFHSGVESLILTPKDKKTPSWQHSSIGSVLAEEVNKYFEPESSVEELEGLEPQPNISMELSDQQLHSAIGKAAVMPMGLGFDAFSAIDGGVMPEVESDGVYKPATFEQTAESFTYDMITPKKKKEVHSKSDAKKFVQQEQEDRMDRNSIEYMLKKLKEDMEEMEQEDELIEKHCLQIGHVPVQDRVEMGLLLADAEATYRAPQISMNDPPYYSPVDTIDAASGASISAYEREEEDLNDEYEELEEMEKEENEMATYSAVDKAFEEEERELKAELDRVEEDLKKLGIAPETLEQTAGNGSGSGSGGGAGIGGSGTARSTAVEESFDDEEFADPGDILMESELDPEEYTEYLGDFISATGNVDDIDLYDQLEDDDVEVGSVDDATAYLSGASDSHELYNEILSQELDVADEYGPDFFRSEGLLTISHVRRVGPIQSRMPTDNARFREITDSVRDLMGPELISGPIPKSLRDTPSFQYLRGSSKEHEGLEPDKLQLTAKLMVVEDEHLDEDDMPEILKESAAEFSRDKGDEVEEEAKRPLFAHSWLMPYERAASSQFEEFDSNRFQIYPGAESGPEILERNLNDPEYIAALQQTYDNWRNQSKRKRKEGEPEAEPIDFATLLTDELKKAMVEAAKKRDVQMLQKVMGALGDPKCPAFFFPPNEPGTELADFEGEFDEEYQSRQISSFMGYGRGGERGSERGSDRGGRGIRGGRPRDQQVAAAEPNENQYSEHDPEIYNFKAAFGFDEGESATPDDDTSELMPNFSSQLEDIGQDDLEGETVEECLNFGINQIDEIMDKVGVKDRRTDIATLFKEFLHIHPVRREHCVYNLAVTHWFPSFPTSDPLAGIDNTGRSAIEARFSGGEINESNDSYLNSYDQAFGIEMESEKLDFAKASDLDKTRYAVERLRDVESRLRAAAVAIEIAEKESEKTITGRPQTFEQKATLRKDQLDLDVAFPTQDELNLNQHLNDHFMTHIPECWKQDELY